MTLNLTGERFGSLLVQDLAGINKWYDRLWRCVCDCGNTSVASGGNLRSGHTRSCGCTHVAAVIKARDVKAAKYLQLTEKSCKCGAPAGRMSLGKCQSCWTIEYERTPIERGKRIVRFREYMRKQRSAVGRIYVLKLLNDREQLFPSRDVPRGLVEAKRAHLRVKRLLRGA